MKLPTLTSSEALREAERLAAAGDFEPATRMYNAVLVQDPTNKKARKGLRDLQARTKQALTEADFERVEAYMRTGRGDAARAEIQRLCKLHPQQPALQNMRGVILAQLGEREAALEAFKQAMRLEPGFNEALNNAASVFADLQRYDESLHCYQELLKRGVQSAEVYHALGSALRGAKRYDDAVEAFRRALRLQPAYPDALNNLGNVLNDLGRHDEALESYEDAVALAPSHELALLNRLRSLSAMQRFQAALHAVQDYRRHYEESPTTLRISAEALLALGQKTAATENLDRLLVLEPDNSIARHMLGALKGTGPDVANPDYALLVFESYAAKFEKHLTQELAYRLPEQMPAILHKLDGDNAWYESALDLGCGTGLVGANVRSYCSHLVGVDVSPSMLDKAAEKAVYDKLYMGDASTWLDATEECFNLLICADMLVYVGAVEDLFTKLSARMAPGARLIVSTEQSSEKDLELRETGRYAHSAAYMRRCAQSVDLKVTAESTIQLRRERGAWLEGGLFVFTQPDGDASTA